MEEMNTNTNMSMQPRSGSKGKKVLLGLLIVLLVLVAGGAAGYAVGIMNKDREVEKAKQDARAEAESQHQASGDQNQGGQTPLAPPKTVTETTCNADELSLNVTESSEAGAGTLAYNLELTNTGERTCMLDGFPGVSLVNDNGNMIGSPAERATNYEEKTLTLAPNGAVMSVVYVPNSANFENGECKEGATKFRVYPPNDTGYLSAVAPVSAWCPGFTVSPVLAM